MSAGELPAGHDPTVERLDHDAEGGWIGADDGLPVPPLRGALLLERVKLVVAEGDQRLAVLIAKESGDETGGEPDVGESGHRMLRDESGAELSR